MSERRSTRARTAREEAEAAAAAEPPKETPSKAVKQSAKKGGKSSTKNSQNKKRKLASEPPHESIPGTPAGELALEPVKPLLPVKLMDGQPLPTLPEPQALDLPSSEYQSIQQSGVLSASLQRSRATWTSGANFRTFCTKFVPPRLVKNRTKEDNLAVERQNEIKKNVPLVGSGNATLIVEPHTFPIQFFASKEPARSVQKQKQVYGQWPQSQYPSYQSYNHTPTPQYPRPTVQQPPNPPKPPPPPKQTIPQPPPPPPAPPAPTTPAPDPVIHMLAQRAGSDPQLKAVMKIVAAGQATKEQLEFFQGHINELSEILQKQKAQAKMVPPPAPAPPPPPPPAPVPPPQPAPVAAPPPAPALASGPQTPNPQRAYPSGPVSSTQGPAPPPQQPQPPYSPFGGIQPHMSPYPPVTQPPKPTFRPLVFEFTEGNGDKFHFPSYSFLEWLPGGRAVKLSFLITKMKPTVKEKSPAPPGVPTTPAAAATPGPSTAPTAPMATMTPAPTGTVVNSAPEAKMNGTNPTPAPTNPATPAPPPPQHPAKPHPSPGITAPKPEDLDEKTEIKDIEFYQPITVIIASHDTEVLQALPRAVRPPDVVEKYMEEVFDTCRRADETYLAFRLPKEGGGFGGEERGSRRGSLTPVTPGGEMVLADKKRGGRAGSGTPVVLQAVGGDKKSVGRHRKSLVEVGKG